MTEQLMSMRDYLASHAPAVPETYPWEQIDRVVQSSDGLRSVMKVREPALRRIVRWSYDYADAMLAASRAII